jgi:putative heme iron utilization protein
LADKPSVLRETDEDARKLARTLLRGSRFGTIAVIDAETGYPNASRVLLATAPDGTPAILVSALSAHTKALDKETRCSLLTGEPGKGDPLAHPRLTLQADAETVERDSRMHGWLRQRFLNRHPKAALYIDFPDFRFILLKPVLASLNGGFGRAYALPGEDFVIRHPNLEDLANREQSVLEALERDYPELSAEVAKIIFRQVEGNWRFSGIDAHGADLSSGDLLRRLELPFENVSLPRMISDIRKVACSIP